MGIGASILTTATMAGISLTFALVTVLHAALWAALPFAVAWGLAILSLDRLFVVSMQRQKSKWASFWLALPRFLLSLLLGAVISTPFVLVIFRPEINHQITQIQNQAAARYFQQLPGSSLSRQIAMDQKQVTNLAAASAASGPVIDSAAAKTLQSLETLLNNAKQKEVADRNELQCQLYGVPFSGSGTCPPGVGQIAADTQQAVTSDEAQVNQYNKEINSLLRSSQAQQVSQAKPAGKELATAEQQLARDTAEQNRETAAFLSSNKGDTGLLIRLQALTAAASGSGTLKAAQVLLFLLLVAIDCMPVLVKLLQNLGREGVYDAKLREWQDTEIAAAQAAAASAQNRLNGLSAALPEVTENVKTARREVEDAWLRAWKTEQLRRIANGQNISPPPTGVGPAPPASGRPNRNLSRLFHRRSRGRPGRWFHAPARVGATTTTPGVSPLVLQRLVLRQDDPAQDQNGNQSP